MFCDLVGSTSLAAKLDSEDWRNLANAYLEAASREVIAQRTSATGPLTASPRERRSVRTS
jgi:hypothetical protein